MAPLITPGNIAAPARAEDERAEVRRCFRSAPAAATPAVSADDCEHATDGMSRYVRVLASPVGWLICLVWLGATVLGALSFGSVLSELRTEFLPLKGSAAEAAVNAYNAAFPHNKTADTIAVRARGRARARQRCRLSASSCAPPLSQVLWSADGGALSMPAVRNVTASLAAFCAPYAAAGRVVSGPVSATALADAGWASTAASLVTADGSTTFVRITTAGGTKKNNEFVMALRAALPAMLPPGVDGGLTGMTVMTEENQHAIESDIVKSDAVTLPLSLALLACVVRSARLVLLTIACLAAAILTSFAVELALAKRVAVPTFVVSLMVATTVAISLDYSLFLLSFMRSRLARAGSAAAGAEDMRAAVAAMLHRTAHTILVSGATLSACFFSLAFFPVPLLRWPGISTGIAVCFAVIVNITLLPALLLAFPRFWAGDALRTPACLLRLGDAALRAASAALARVTPAPTEAAKKHAGQAGEDEDGDGDDDDGGALWHALAMFTQRYRRVVAALFVLLLLLPFAPHLRGWHVSQAWEGSTPKGAQSLRLYRLMAARFGGATTTAPSLLLGVARNASSDVLSPPLFAATQAAVRAVLVARPDTVVNGLFWSGSNATSLGSVRAALAMSCPTGLACASACPELVCAAQTSARNALAPQRNAVLVKLQPVLDTFTGAGYDWAKSVRAAVLAADAADPLFAWHYVGDSGVNIADAVAYVYDFFPALMGATAAVVFIIVGTAFRSIVTPLRTIATIAVMVVAVYGAACAVYAMGLIDGADSRLFTSDNGGLYWLIPVLCFSISVGLGLDYDIFLIERVLQERRAGWDDVSAVVRGVRRSGPIISWAGAIMAVAFGGLFSASLPLLNQLAFFIVFGVIIDTFVVRTFLVPALMGVLGAANWWPTGRALPPPTKTLPDVAALAQRANTAKVAPVAPDAAARV